MPLIDYFTTFAQIVNFLVLVLLLRHFLYRPVVRSMDEREKRILSRSNEAEQKKKEALQEAESYRKMKQEMQDKQKGEMAKVEEDAKVLRSGLEKKARDEVEAEKATWLESIEAQKSDLIEEMGWQAGEGVHAISRRALQDLANGNLEEQIIDMFLRRLQDHQSLSEPERDALREFSKDFRGKIVVKSSFDISDQVRQRIKDAVRGLTGVDAEMQFELDRGLISGIELSANSVRISWSIASYLDDLKSDLSSALDEKIAGEIAAK